MNLQIKKVIKNNNIIHIILDKPENFQFYPGQYLDIELPVIDPLGKTRIFSISSSPSEDFLMFTYELGITPYKKKLETLQPDDTVSSTHPAGTVVIDNSSPIVMLAGGIGIAPHRSMIKWAVDRKLNLPITLIYSNSDDDFIFKEELDKWQKKLPNLKIIYQNTNENGRLNLSQLDAIVQSYDNTEAIYYLAGPPGMVDDFEEILLKLGVDETSIRTDRFDGY